MPSLPQLPFGMPDLSNFMGIAQSVAGLILGIAAQHGISA